MKLESGRLEQPMIDLGSDPAQGGYLFLLQAGIQPGLLQRAAVEFDVQASRLASAGSLLQRAGNDYREGGKNQRLPGSSRPGFPLPIWPPG